MTPLAIVLLLTGAGLVCTELLGPPPRGRRPRFARRNPVARLGSSIRTRGCRWLPSLDAVDDGLLGTAACATVGLGLVAPPLAPVPLLVAAGIGLGRTRAGQVGRRQAVDRGLVQVVDLLALAIAGGLPLRSAFGAVASRLPDEHRILALGLLDRVQRGESFVVALRWYGDQLGPPGRELVAVLISSERDGAPLAAGLERAADATRRAQRRELERRARRLPVTLLLPLVCCVLPAFVVLTLVPLLAGTLGDLRFPT